MHTQAHRGRRGFITRRGFWSLWLSSFLGTAPLVVVADPQYAGTETASATVSFAGLDLTTPVGISAARERLVAAAQHLCHRLSDSLRASNSATSAACYRETLADATQRFDTMLRATSATGTELSRNTQSP
jgi:UrcA family protein